MAKHFNTARLRLHVRRGTPKNETDLALMTARDRERWLSTALFPEHAVYFLARHRWRKAMRKGEAVMFTIAVGSA